MFNLIILHADTQLQWSLWLYMIIVSNVSLHCVLQWMNLSNSFADSPCPSQRGIYAFYFVVVYWLKIE